MTDRMAKTLLYEQFARVGKALASPVRLELLDLLAQGERGVEDLAAAAGLRLSNASAQLQVLASAGLATSRRSGRHVYYRPAGDAAGLLAATYFATYTWFDLGRVDSLFLALSVAGLYAARWAGSTRGAVVAGLLLGSR